MAQQSTQGRADAEDQRTKADTREPLGKVVEVIGASRESFDDAIRTAVRLSAETTRHITGIEVQKMTAKVDGEEIVEYRVDLKLAFGVERER